MHARLGVLAFLGAAAGCFSLPSSEEFASGRPVVDGGATPASSREGATNGARAPYVFTCPPGALVCADFEGGEVGGSFQELVGAATRDGRTVHGGGGALHARVATGQESSGATTLLSDPPAKLSLDLWFQVTAPPTNERYRMRLSHLLFGPGCDWDVSAVVWIASDALHLGLDTYDKDRNPSCGPVDNSALTLLPAARLFQPVWHHLVVTVDNTTQERKVRARIDDEPEATTSIVSRRAGNPAALSFGVGVLCIQTDGGCFAYDSGGAFDVWVDDVMLAP